VIVDHLLAERLGRAGQDKLARAMRYSALAPGKRIRPLLAIASFRACGAAGNAIYGPAAALELIHAYSLIHDDLPDFDNDSLRRGRPTSHIVHGEPLALAAGLALLAEGLAWIAEAPVACKQELVRTVTRAIGLEGMIAGQYLDLLSEGCALEPAQLLRVHEGKTGRLIRAAVLTGALVAGARSRLRDGLARYGDELGLAFQITDDLLDVIGNEEMMGKTAGADAQASKATFVSVFGTAGARAHARSAADRARAIAASLPLEKGLLLALADFVEDRAH
jgi:geranylgeranyl pyrophosphate synthase